MKTKEHWQEAKSLLSYHTANKIALNLREFAKSNKLCSKGIKSLDKESAYRYGFFSDAAVLWTDGPDGWAKRLDLKEILGISYDIRENSLLIYDVVLPTSQGADDDQY